MSVKTKAKKLSFEDKVELYRTLHGYMGNQPGATWFAYRCDDTDYQKVLTALVTTVRNDALHELLKGDKHAVHRLVVSMKKYADEPMLKAQVLHAVARALNTHFVKIKRVIDHPTTPLGDTNAYRWYTTPYILDELRINNLNDKKIQRWIDRINIDYPIVSLGKKEIEGVIRICAHTPRDQQLAKFIEEYGVDRGTTLHTNLGRFFKLNK